jgi:hypothetical protein
MNFCGVNETADSFHCVNVFHDINDNAETNFDDFLGEYLIRGLGGVRG